MNRHAETTVIALAVFVLTACYLFASNDQYNEEQINAAATQVEQQMRADAAWRDRDNQAALALFDIPAPVTEEQYVTMQLEWLFCEWGSWGYLFIFERQFTRFARG